MLLFISKKKGHKIEAITEFTWLISVGCTFSSHFLKETQFCVTSRYKYVRKKCKGCKYKYITQDVLDVGIAIGENDHWAALNTGKTASFQPLSKKRGAG